jgi:hypothetical protein
MQHRTERHNGPDMFETIPCYSVTTVLAPSVEESIEPSVDQVEQFKTLTLRKLIGLRCAVHGKPPVIEFRGITLRDIRISMRCCCRQMSALANQAIAKPFSRS